MMQRDIAGGFSIPDMYFLILTGGSDPGSIGRQEHRAYPIIVSMVLGDQMTFVERLPDLDVVLFAG